MLPGIINLSLYVLIHLRLNDYSCFSESWMMEWKPETEESQSNVDSEADGLSQMRCASGMLSDKMSPGKLRAEQLNFE